MQCKCVFGPLMLDCSVQSSRFEEDEIVVEEEKCSNPSRMPFSITWSAIPHSEHVVHRAGLKAHDAPTLLATPQVSRQTSGKGLPQPRDWLFVEDAYIEGPQAPWLSRGDAQPPQGQGCWKLVGSAEAPAPTRSGAAALAGRWRCVATEGLDDFLRATGVGALQRRLAAAAQWPTWHFEVDGEGDVIVFTNHSAMGELREEVRLDGASYQNRDGRGNAFMCRAEWKATFEGGVLTIARAGELGDFTEERRVEGDTLVFELRDGEGNCWGRTFRRE